MDLEYKTLIDLSEWPIFVRRWISGWLTVILINLVYHLGWIIILRCERKIILYVYSDKLLAAAPVHCPLKKNLYKFVTSKTSCISRYKFTINMGTQALGLVVVTFACTDNAYTHVSLYKSLCFTPSIHHWPFKEELYY